MVAAEGIYSIVMANYPTLVLPPNFNAQESYPDHTLEITLGDGYTYNSVSTNQPTRAEWLIRRNGLSKEEVDEIVEQLSIWGGFTPFYWQPHPGVQRKLYFCEKWAVTPLGLKHYEFSATFVEDIRGECLSLGALIDPDDIEAKLSNAYNFLISLTNNTGNYLIRESNNLVCRSLHTHSEQVPSTHGTLFDQVYLALACIAAYECTNSTTWLDKAIQFGNAIVTNYYNSDPENGSYLPHWLFDIKADNRLEEIYPTSITLPSNTVNAPFGYIPILWELYTKLTLHNPTNPQWGALAESTKNDYINLVNFSKQTIIYRKNEGSPTEYPGTAIPNGLASRVNSGIFQNFVSVSGTNDLIVQNNDIESLLDNNTYITINVGSDTENSIIDCFISNSTNDNALTAIFRQFFLVEDNIVYTRSVNSYEFMNYTQLAWTAERGLSNEAANYTTQSITYQTNTFDNVVLELTSSASLNLNSSNSSKTPFKFFIKVNNGPIVIRLRDASNRLWDYSVNTMDWGLLEPTWTNFSWSSANGTTQGSIRPNSTENILEVRFLVGSGNVVYIWWVGASLPIRLNNPSIIYRAGVRFSNTLDKTLYVGDVKVNNSPSDVFYKTPGVIPFSRTIENGIILNILNGLPNIGYQNLWVWQQFNLTEHFNNVVDFSEASKNYYASTIGESGPFTPNFNWSDTLNPINEEDSDSFTFLTTDNFYTSGEYQVHFVLYASKAWYELKSNLKLKNIVMNWLQWLDQIYTPRVGDLPPINYPNNSFAIAGNNPGIQAVIGEIALWANLSGGDPAITFRAIKRTLDYLQQEYILPGEAMSGSWGFSQPSFSGSLKQYYSWWHSACIRFYSTLLNKKPSIVYPPCSEPLSIFVSEPPPTICCNIPPSPPTDPYFSSVHLLLHFEGSNGSTTFIDSSSFSRTVTLSSPGPTISTINPLVETSSGLFTGLDGNLVVADYGLTNVSFTIEAFISLADVIGNKVIYTIYGNSFPTQIRAFSFIVLGDKLSVYHSPSAGVSTLPLISSTSLIPNRVYYVAFTYNHDSGVWSIYIDGELEDSKVVTTKIDSSTFNHQIGGAALSTNHNTWRFNGKIDELRVTQGIVRPITGIPNVPFPNA